MLLPEEQQAWDELVAREEPAMTLRANFWGLVTTAWQPVRHPRRYPRRALAVLVSVVVLAGVAFLAVHAPAGGCRLEVVSVRGERAHWVCVQNA